ncbi:MAG: hypothetical protein ACXIT9_07130 [Nitritalea sp.]
MSTTNTSIPIFPMPMRGILLLAGMYSFAWAAFFRYFGEDVLRWLAMQSTWESSLSAQYLGAFGMLTGFLLFLSAFYPISWIYLLMAGMVGKIIAAIWFSVGFAPELGWNKRSLFHLLFTELFWLIPLGIVLVRGWQVRRYIASLPEEEEAPAGQKKGLSQNKKQ